MSSRRVPVPQSQALDVHAGGTTVEHHRLNVEPRWTCPCRCGCAVVPARHGRRQHTSRPPKTPPCTVSHAASVLRNVDLPPVAHGWQPHVDSRRTAAENPTGRSRCPVGVAERRRAELVRLDAGRSPRGATGSRSISSAGAAAVGHAQRCPRRRVRCRALSACPAPPGSATTKQVHLGHPGRRHKARGEARVVEERARPTAACTARARAAGLAACSCRPSARR